MLRQLQPGLLAGEFVISRAARRPDDEPDTKGHREAA
jgi:hypothetical protein